MSGRKGAAAFLAAVLAACSWPFLTRVFVAPSWAGALWMLLIAFFLLERGAAGQTRIGRFSALYLVALPMLVAAGVLLPWPYGLGAFLIACAVASARPLARERGTPIVVGLLLLGMMLLVHAMLLPPTIEAMARGHRVAGVAPIVAALLRIFGVDATSQGTSVFVVALRETMQFRVSPELLGFPVALLTLAGGVLVEIVLGGRSRRAWRLSMMTGSWAAFLVLRAVLMILLVMQLQLHVGYDDTTIRADVLWNPWWSLASFIPLSLVWAGLCRFAPVEDRKPVFTRFRPLRDSAAAIFAMLGVALVVFAFQWHGSGTPRGGRVMIDESHSDWEKTNRILDTRWYGDLSMYNMFSLSDYLEYYYPVARNTQSPITREMLADVDVLVLKVPTASYDNEEVSAIVDFVERGGGLFMIAEHTNYLGSTEHLNRVAGHFGIRVEEDGLFNLTGQTDVTRLDDTPKARPPCWPNKPFNQVWEKPALGAHALVAPLPTFRFRPSPTVAAIYENPTVKDFSYRFQVSCSLESSSLFTRPVIMSTGMYRIFADYHMDNYYPPPEVDTDLHFGAFLQMAACEAGRGRVAVFTDSTTFSNFASLYPGNSELMLSTVSWLNRESMGRGRRAAAACAGLALLLAALGLLLGKSSDRAGGSVLLVSATALGATLTLVACRAAAERAHPMPAPRTQPARVAFLREHCDYDVPVVDFVSDYELSYNLFYQWVLRLRYFPQIRFTLDEALNDRALVIPNPGESFSVEETRRIREYLEGGGNVLVLLRPTYLRRPEFMAGEVIDYSPAATSLIEPFGMSLGERPETVIGGLIDASNTPAGTDAQGVVISGGTPVYTIEGKTVVASKTVGKGELIVAGVGDLFIDTMMGTTYSALPDATTKARYEVEFNLFRRLLPPAANLPQHVLTQIEEEATLAP